VKKGTHIDPRAVQNYALRFTTAWKVVEHALEEERKLLHEHLANTRNDLAKYRWLRSCGDLSLALNALEEEVDEFAAAAALAKEWVS
jgi:hypothetical protein